MISLADRSEKRIAPLIDELEALWREVPEQRFGQLLMNLARTPDGFADTWEWDAAEYHSRITRFRILHGLRGRVG
jgi:hypothetical protein